MHIPLAVIGLNKAFAVTDRTLRWHALVGFVIVAGAIAR
jgi:multidrug efflux pump subunit AcrB